MIPLPTWAKGAALVLIGLVLYVTGRMDGMEIKGAELAQYQQEVAQASLQQQQQARAKEQNLQHQLQEAQHAAQERQTRLLADADRARTESERLRGDLASIRHQLPGLTDAAVRRYALTASVVLDECSRDYQGLAATADRIDSDRQTLEDAWPK